MGAFELLTHQPPAKLSVAQVAAKIRPSVVTVKATVFRDGVAEGQGFFYGAQGHVLTSARVLTHATHVDVIAPTGEESPAALVGIDKANDVAELATFDKKGLPLFAAPGAVAVGAQVVVFGNPYSQLPYTVHQGTVAGTGRQLALKALTFSDLVETDVAVHPANIGGPIVNMSGQLVGMVEPGDAGHAFAVPPSLFSVEAKSWAVADATIRLGPPLVTIDGSGLILSGVPLDGFAQTQSVVWRGRGIHVVYLRAPTYDYGGTSIDIWLDVEADESSAHDSFQLEVGNSKSRGFSQAATSSALGDEAIFLQRIASDQVAYEVTWRDRNVNAYMYLGSGIPPAPDVSLPTLIALAIQQEGPIAANLADW